MPTGPRIRPRRGWLVLLAALVVSITVVTTGAASVVTARLYARSPADREAAEVVADALPRLAYLREALDAGAGERMQRLFPEGYYFTSALYGLTWVDVGMRDPAWRDRAHAEVRWSLERLDSQAGRAPFSPHSSPPYGVFYAGWTSWLRGGAVRLAGGPQAAPADAERFFADTDALAAAFTASLDGSGSPFLPAYPGQAWPVDSMVGVAALALADHVRGDARHRTLIERWRGAADARRDPATGLLPHRVDVETGYLLEGARATSQTVILRFLREVDPEVAAADWRVFRDRFASPVPGLPGFREYPRGVDGSGDVDSGPLLFGLSASASVVALGDAALFGDRATARALTGLVEGTGAAIEIDGKRRYAGGALPVGDAFVAWSMAADGWVVPAGVTAPPAGGGFGWWRLPWHLAMIWLLAPVWLLSWVIVNVSRTRRPPAISNYLAS